MPTTMSGENPMNQASFSSLVVPVLPAIGLPTSFTTIAVPPCTTPSIIEVISYAVFCLKKKKKSVEDMGGEMNYIDELLRQQSQMRIGQRFLDVSQYLSLLESSCVLY